MNTFSRILALLLALVTLLCFTACDSTPDQPDTPDDDAIEPSPDDTTPDDTTPDEPPTDTLPKNAVNLTKDTIGSFHLLRSDFCTSAITSTAMALRSAINEATGGKIEPKTDWEETPAGIKTVIVGNTKHPASAGVKDSLKESGFRICVVDGNIIICGSDDVMTGYGVTHFINKFVTGKTIISVPNDTDITISSLEWLTKHAPAPVTHKKSYSE